MKLLSAKYMWYIIYYYDVYLIPSVWVQWLHSLCFCFSRQINQQRESPLHNHPSLRVYESPNLWPSLSSAAEEMVANSPGVREPTGSTYPPYQVLQDASSSSFLCFLQLLPRLLHQKLKNSAATPKLGRVCGKVFNLDVNMTPLAPNFSGVRIGQRATKKKNELQTSHAIILQACVDFTKLLLKKTSGPVIWIDWSILPTIFPTGLWTFLCRLLKFPTVLAGPRSTPLFCASPWFECQTPPLLPPPGWNAMDHDKQSSGRCQSGLRPQK